MTARAANSRAGSSPSFGRVLALPPGGRFVAGPRSEARLSWYHRTRWVFDGVPQSVFRFSGSDSPSEQAAQEAAAGSFERVAVGEQSFLQHVLVVEPRRGLGKAKWYLERLVTIVGRTSAMVAGAVLELGEGGGGACLRR